MENSLLDTSEMITNKLLGDEFAGQRLIAKHDGREGHFVIIKSQRVNIGRIKVVVGSAVKLHILAGCDFIIEHTWYNSVGITVDSKDRISIILSEQPTVLKKPVIHIRMPVLKPPCRQAILFGGRA